MHDLYWISVSAEYLLIPKFFNMNFSNHNKLLNLFKLPVTFTANKEFKQKIKKQQLFPCLQLFSHQLPRLGVYLLKSRNVQFEG